MSKTEDRAKGFILQCIEQCKQIKPDPQITDFHCQLIIQLTGKVFELEEQIRELKNEQQRL